MRHPFLLFLFAIISFFWLKDCAGFFFYLANTNIPNINIYNTIIGLAGLVALFYILKNTLFKKAPLPSVREILQPERKKEWLVLLFVSLPIILLALFRCISPDEGYYTAHYEIYLQEFNFGENKTNFGVGAIRT